MSIDLDHFGALLAEEREDVRRQLADLGANPDEDSLDNVQFDAGFADSAQATAERAKVLAMVEQLRERLADCNHALERLERGDYGKCERCGNEIDPQRLEVLPAARLCVRCKQEVGA